MPGLRCPDTPLPHRPFRPGAGPAPPPEAVPAGRKLDRAIDLFDHGFWWEAHRHLEDLWRGAAGAEREALQALVQACAACLKVEAGEARAAERLARRVAERAGSLPGGRWRGVDLARLARDLDAFRAGGPRPLVAAPSPADRRALRVAAASLAARGLAVGALALLVVPWRTPAVNAALLALAAPALAASPLLAAARRSGWLLARAAALASVAAGVLAAAALVGSWAWVHGVYDDLGWGMALGSLLGASGALQVLVAWPALELALLGRPGVRAAVGASPPRPRLRRAALALALGVPLAAAGAAHARAALGPALTPLDPERAALAVRALRAGLEGRPLPDLSPLEGLPAGPVPLEATLWAGGAPAARVRGEAPDLAAAVRAAAGSWPPGLPDGRIELHRARALGPVARDGPLLVLGVNVGMDGLVGENGRVAWPEDLLRARAAGHAAPLPGIRELRLGLDPDRARDVLGAPPAARLRAEGWIESADRSLVLPVVRGSTPLRLAGAPSPPGAPAPAGLPDHLRAEAWRAAAVAAGRHLLRRQLGDGHLAYRFGPTRGRLAREPRHVNVPRQAGATWALALLARETGDPDFAAGARRAAAWLARRARSRCGPGRCVASGGRASLGASALAAVALLETARATGDADARTAAAGLVAFLRAMQRPDGRFHHEWVLRTDRPDPAPRHMFAGGQAALALIMAAETLGDTAAGDAGRRALDALVRPEGPFLLGRLVYGADAWTCAAADEALPAASSPRWTAFCLGYARFLRRLQYAPRRWDNLDFAGHYGLGALMVPQAPAAAGFSEAVAAAADLARRTTGPAPDVEEQLAAGLDALARDALRADNDFLCPDRVACRGAVRRSLVEPVVRVDFPQHALVAWLRGVRLAEGRPW